MSRAEEIGSTILMVGGAGLVLALLWHEWRVWAAARLDAAARPRARARLARRTLGGVLLLTTVLLLRFPDTADWGPWWRLARWGALMAFCLAVFLVALWDFRIVRDELRQDLRGFVAESAQDLQRHLSDLAAQNPQVAEKLRQSLAKRGAALGASSAASEEEGRGRPPQANS